MHMNAILVFKIDRKEIEDDAILGVVSGAMAHAYGFDRVATQYPVHYIDVMNMLLNDMVATQVSVVIPVVELGFSRCHAWFWITGPKDTLVPIATATNDVANRAFVKLLDGFDVGRLMPALGACNNTKSAGIGFIVSSQAIASCRAVYANGLFGKDILLGFNRSHDVDRAKPRRGCEDDIINLGIVHDFLVGINSRMNFVICDFYFVVKFFNFWIILGNAFQASLKALGLGFKSICDGMNGDIACRIQDVMCSAATTTTATYHAYADFVATLGISACGKNSVEGNAPCSSHGAGLDKVSSIGSALFLTHFGSPIGERTENTNINS